MAPEHNLSPPSSATRLHVRTGTAPHDTLDLQFETSFRIGRADDCGVCIKNDYVSRNHAEVFCDKGQWWVRDLHSSNGIFIGDQRIEVAPVGQSATIRLGAEGPTVSL